MSIKKPLTYEFVISRFNRNHPDESLPVRLSLMIRTENETFSAPELCTQFNPGGEKPKRPFDTQTIPKPYILNMSTLNTYRKETLQ